MLLISASKHRCCSASSRSHSSRTALCPSLSVMASVPLSKNRLSVTPKAPQIRSSDENEGVIPFLYQEEMVLCGIPDRSAN